MKHLYVHSVIQLRHPSVLQKPNVFCCRHNFLKVYYGSEVKGEVDFIEGDSSMRSFSSGYYSDQGMRVTEMEVTTRTLSVRPRKPFGVSTEFWSE